MDGSQQRPTLIGVEQQKMVVGEGGRVFRKQKPRPKLGFYNLDCEYGEGGRRAHRWSCLLYTSDAADEDISV